MKKILTILAILFTINVNAQDVNLSQRLGFVLGVAQTNFDMEGNTTIGHSLGLDYWFVHFDMSWSLPDDPITTIENPYSYAAKKGYRSYENHYMATHLGINIAFFKEKLIVTPKIGYSTRFSYYFNQDHKLLFEDSNYLSYGLDIAYTDIFEIPTVGDFGMFVGASRHQVKFGIKISTLEYAKKRKKQWWK